MGVEQSPPFTSWRFRFAAHSYAVQFSRATSPGAELCPSEQYLHFLKTSRGIGPTGRKSLDQDLQPPSVENRLQSIAYMEAHRWRQ